MTAQQMLGIIPSLQKLMELQLPIKKSYEVYKLIKNINEQKDFFALEERKLIDKYNATILENGNIKFITKEDQINFSEEYEVLMNCEIDVVAAVELTFDDLGSSEFSPKEIMALEGVINFID